MIHFLFISWRWLILFDFPVILDRQKVLRHHPDKRKAAGEEVRADDDYFTCITKAYETLSVASKRRAYDSVDSEFDDEVPTNNAANKARFFEVKQTTSAMMNGWGILQEENRFFSAQRNRITSVLKGDSPVHLLILVTLIDLFQVAWRKKVFESKRVIQLTNDAVDTSFDE